MLAQKRPAGSSDRQIQAMLADALGPHLADFRSSGPEGGLPRLETFDSILYSLDKQDLIQILKTTEILSAAVSPRVALHTLVRKVAEILDASRCSLIFLSRDRKAGTVAISHEAVDFEGVTISLDVYPEILQAVQSGAITIVKDPARDPLMHALKQEQLRTIRDVSIMSLPLVFRKQAFAVLLVRKRRSEEGFNIREVRMCQLVLGMVVRTLQRMCEGPGAEETAKPGSTPAQPEEGGTGLGKDSILFRAAPVGILLLDRNDRVIRANPQASEITGIPEETLVGMSYAEIVPAERIEEIRRMRKSLAAEGELLRYHLSYQGPGEETKTLSFERHPLAAPDGHACIFFRDVTKEKELEEHLQGKTRQLTKANRRLQEARSSLLQRNRELHRTNERLEELHKMKTAFLAIATHEIRTPLSIILGYDRILLQEKFGSLKQEQRRILDESVQSCERLLNIVNEMLDFTKLESGKWKLQQREDDIVPLLRRVYRQMKMISERAGIRFDLDLPEGPTRLFFDPDRIEQVLVNLLSNAIKFTPEGGSISLAAAPKGGPGSGWFEIAVSDTGSGLPPESLNKVFDGLYPFSAESSERGGAKSMGVGLGLGISKRIIEAHGGRIEARSREGQGSTFLFCLPLQADRTSPAPQEADSVRKGQPA
ncbi:MAG: ATP-binding protein [bacterium]